MWTQTVTVFKKTIDGDTTTYTPTVYNNVHLDMAEGETLSAQGEVVSGGTVLMIRGNPDIHIGDYVIVGTTEQEAFSGNPVKVLPSAMRVTGRRYWGYSSLSHTTLTLGGGIP